MILDISERLIVGTYIMIIHLHSKGDDLKTEVNQMLCDGITYR